MDRWLQPRSDVTEKCDIAEILTKKDLHTIKKIPSQPNYYRKIGYKNTKHPIATKRYQLHQGSQNKNEKQKEQKGISCLVWVAASRPGRCTVYTQPLIQPKKNDVKVTSGSGRPLHPPVTPGRGAG